MSLRPQIPEVTIQPARGGVGMGVVERGFDTFLRTQGISPESSHTFTAGHPFLIKLHERSCAT